MKTYYVIGLLQNIYKYYHLFWKWASFRIEVFIFRGTGLLGKIKKRGLNLSLPRIQYALNKLVPLPTTEPKWIYQLRCSMIGSHILAIVFYCRRQVPLISWKHKLFLIFNFNEQKISVFVSFTKSFPVFIPFRKPQGNKFSQHFHLFTAGPIWDKY